MVNSLRERRKQQLRDEILQAAHTLMMEKGYAAVVMDDVAARVGVTKPTIYNYFNNREELIVAAVIQRMDRAIDLIVSEAGEASPLKRLSLLLRTFIQRQIDEGAMALRPWTPDIFQLICQHPDAVARLREIDNSIVALVHAAIASGEIDPHLDPPTVVRTFYAMVGSLHFASFGVGGTPNPAAVADTLAAIFARGVGVGTPLP